MNKKALHSLIDMVPDSESDIIYEILLKFIPTDLPTEDELLAISAAKESIRREGTVPIESIDWDS